MVKYSSDNGVRVHSIQILNLFYSELKLVNTKPAIKSKLKHLLNGLKKSYDNDKNFISEDWIVETIVEHSIKIFER